MAARQLRTTCCIAGGGPAGMMLGFLLARAGVPVTVLEKHKDFLRDFRGDTVHPSTLELMHELGLLDQFLKLPHSKVDHVSMQIGADTVKIALVGLPTVCKYIAFMPQWDFLDFLAEHGRRYPAFDLRMRDVQQVATNAAGAVLPGPSVPPNARGDFSTVFRHEWDADDRGRHRGIGRNSLVRSAGPFQGVVSHFDIEEGVVRLVTFVGTFAHGIDPLRCRKPQSGVLGLHRRRREDRRFQPHPSSARRTSPDAFTSSKLT